MSVKAVVFFALAVHGVGCSQDRSDLRERSNVGIRLRRCNAGELHSGVLHLHEMFFAAIAHSYAFPRRYNMGQQVLPLNLGNRLELFDVRDVYQDIKTLHNNSAIGLLENTNPASRRRVPSNRASGSRHNQTGDGPGKHGGDDKSLESVEAETLLSRGANTNNFADDQFDVIVSGGSAEGGAIVSTCFPAFTGGLAP